MGIKKTLDRAQWGSRIGFILAAAGSSVGLGGIWKFPYMAARNGGGIFIVIYLLISAILGIALMVAEITMGVLSRKGPVGAYERLGGKHWKPIGYISVFCSFIILSFYSVVGGWTIAYFVKFFQGILLISDAEALTHIFKNFIADPYEPLIYHGIFMLATACVIIAGIQKGIERACKYLMAMLLLLIFILIARVLTLPGAIEGIKLFLEPDITKITPDMLIDVTGMVFFSMSLGMGIMIAYGSYVGDSFSIQKTAVSVVSLTTSISILCGLMILPAITVFGIDPQTGPGLTFISMPAVFSQMKGGYCFGLFFFFLLFVAAISSSVSLMEPVVGFFVDEYHTNRIVTSVVMSVLMFILGIAASLSFGIGQEITFWGRNFFDFLDFISSNLMMPFCAIAVSLLIGWKIWPIFTKRIVGERKKFPFWLQMMKPFFRFVIPIIIATVLLQNLL